MKKLVMAAAVLGAFAGGAQAQTSVALYGIVDGNVRFDKTNIGKLRSIGNGGEAGSRWGLRGSEDLGGGLKANFILEQGFDIGNSSVPEGDIGTGSSAGFGGLSTAPRGSSGSRVWSRIATVGLAGPFGEVRFGRGYNPLFMVQFLADPFAAGTVGAFWNVQTLQTFRNDNAIYYDTPRLGGLQASFVQQFGESTTNSTTTQAKRGNDRFGAGLTYANGPLYAGVGYEQIKSNLDTFRTRTFDAAATYDFGVVKLHGVYWHARSGTSPFLPTATLDEHTYIAAVSVPFGAWTFLGSFARVNDKSRSNVGVNLGSPKANVFSFAARYSLSKRTVLYAAYSRFNLKRGPLGNPYQGFIGIRDPGGNGLYTAANLAGVDPFSYQFGIRHSF